MDYKNNQLFVRMMTSKNGGNTVNKEFHEIINELKILKSYESSTINKMRTEFINLNNYISHFHKNNSNIKNMCCYCLEKNEDIIHFVLKCPRFERQRKKLFKNLRQISIKFKNKANISINDILFPHMWQIQPNTKDPWYKEKLYNNTLIRIKILRELVQFTKETKRFKGEFGE